MGHFYTNLAVHNADPARVAELLRSKKRRGYVSPASHGAAFVYDEETESQDQKKLTQLAKDLSKDLKTTILAALNHDDDVLQYWLFENGDHLDQYNSWPGAFGEGPKEPTGGDAETLAIAFGVTEATDQLRKVLHDARFVFAYERHLALAKELCLNPECVIVGYVDIARGDIDRKLKDGLIHVK